MNTTYGTLLVVDDNPAILTAVKISMQTVFARIITLSRPEAVLATLQTEHVDAMLLDMNFSLGTNTGQEGMMWLTAFHRRHPALPVVLMTAYADVQLAVRAMKNGAVDFVTKPWDNNRLIGILCEAIDRSRRVTPLEELAADYVHRVVEQCGGNISDAAKLLGVTRQTIYTKIKRP